MRVRWRCLLGVAGLIAAAGVPGTASAQDVNRVIGTLNALVNPQDAQRLEERSRREGRQDEERYWRNYRAGLEQEREGGDEISAEQARRFEERARSNHKVEEEHYWRDYRGGADEHR